MVESAIYFLIGFLAAALLALLAAPAISRRATRLAASRARLQSPLSETQARAERDALRGQHAVEIVRIEKRLAAVQDDHAMSKAELGRRATQIVQLEEQSAERAEDIARQRFEIAALLTESRDLSAQIGAQEIGLRDLTGQRDRTESELALARSRVSELETQIDDNRATIAGLETKVTGLQVELADLRRASIAAAGAAETERVRLSAALTERTNTANTRKEQLDVAAARHQALKVELEGRTAETAGLRERLAQAETRIAQGEEARQALTLAGGHHIARLAERDAALERLEAQRRDDGVRTNARLEAARARENALTAELQALKASHATTEGALGAARADRGGLQREVELLRARLTESMAAAQSVAKGDQALRQSIARLGRDIARGTAAVEPDEPAAAQIVNFARREPGAGHAPELAQTLEKPMASER